LILASSPIASGQSPHRQNAQTSGLLTGASA
jgi:hypothetical protein